MTATTERAILTTPSDRSLHIVRIVHAPRERVWSAFTVADQIAQWWGRGHKVVIERSEVVRGGRWRYVEHADGGEYGFEGRYREVTPMSRIVRTFEYDGFPGNVMLDTTEFEDLGDGRTKIVSTSLFFTQEERDGMLNSGMEGGMNESYAALDRLLAQG